MADASTGTAKHGYDVQFMGYGKMAEGKLASRGIPADAKFVVCEKIHGANFMCSVTASGVHYASRRRLLDSEGPAFYNCGLVAAWLGQRAAALHKAVTAMVEPGGYMLHQLDIVGELYGAHWPVRSAGSEPVQTMPLIWYSPRLEFAAFDLRLWVSPASDDNIPEEGTYVDWPVAERLMRGFGIPMAPVFGLHSREDALHWSLPMESAVRTELGLTLPPGTSIGLQSEGVIVKCEVEKRPLPASVLGALAECTGITDASEGSKTAESGASSSVPITPEAFASLETTHSKSADRARWQRLRFRPATHEAEAEDADIDAGMPEREKAFERERQARWMTKLKCAVFKEVHKVPRAGASGSDAAAAARSDAARRIASAYVPKKSEKLPSSLVAAVCERLTAARMGGAVSKVGPPPVGCHRLLEQWHGKPPMPLWSAEMAEAMAAAEPAEPAETSEPAEASEPAEPAEVSEPAEPAVAAGASGSAGADEEALAAATVDWARAIAAEVMSDLFEELWRDEAKAMARAAKPSAPAGVGSALVLAREHSDAYDNRLTDAVKEEGITAGLSEMVTEVACEPVIGAITHLARTYAV